MPIFVSYSSSDREFADKMAVQLVQNKVPVWFDKWELHAGDSLITKIQQAVAGASALIVILSRASVESSWCTKELNAALIRELEEQRVIVVPVLIEDCEVPVFLREKVYADFRRDFDEGLKTVIEAIARVTNEYQARIDEVEFHSDWAIDWNRQPDGLFAVRLTISEQARNQPYTCLTIVTILCSQEATERYFEKAAVGEEETGRREIVGSLVDSINRSLELTMWLDDQFEQSRVLTIQDEESGASYQVSVASRRLGEDTGRAILLRTGDQIKQIHRHMTEVAAKG